MTSNVADVKLHSQISAEIQSDISIQVFRISPVLSLGLPSMDCVLPLALSIFT